MEFMSAHSIIMSHAHSSEGHSGSTLNGFQRLYQERMLTSFPSPPRTPLEAGIYPSEEVAFLYPVVPDSAQQPPKMIYICLSDSSNSFSLRESYRG